MTQLMPLPLTVSCFSKIQIGCTFLVPAHLGSPGKGPLNGCVCCVGEGSRFTVFTGAEFSWLLRSRVFVTFVVTVSFLNGARYYFVVIVLVHVCEDMMRYECLLALQVLTVIMFTRVVICLQCFDAVGWAAGRASGL